MSITSKIKPEPYLCRHNQCTACRYQRFRFGQKYADSDFILN